MANPGFAWSVENLWTVERVAVRFRLQPTQPGTLWLTGATPGFSPMKTGPGTLMRMGHPSLCLRHARSCLTRVLLIAVLQPGTLQAQRDRDDWQRVPDVLAALAIGEGSYVADVGAGSGYFTEHLARHVGATGRVFAVDISDRALSQLRRLAEREGLENVEVVRGEVDDPRLLAESLDAVLVVNAYHEMTEYEAMLASGMFTALKPGGRLVMLERGSADSSRSRQRQMAAHEMSLALVARELEAAGFDVLERDEHFTENPHQDPQWMLVAKRPTQGS